jgi:hypothetical protein
MSPSAYGEHPLYPQHLIQMKWDSKLSHAIKPSCGITWLEAPHVQ